MKTIRSIFFFIFVMAATSAIAQPPNFDPANMPKEGVIKGVVLDASNNTPVEYANIVLYSMKDSSLITGTITTADGIFELKEVPFGRFYMDINFIGYDKLTNNSLMINPKQKTVDLGKISIKQTSQVINDVEIVADRAHVEYKIDKKVVNVGQDINATGGTAADVLQNVPSVQVDIDNNVTLRGSSNFTVLIDGKPTALKGSDALQQIPASTIKQIEIITNPSAKYDPEGMAGIINLVMKKNALTGISGIANVSVGTGDKYRADVLVNYKTARLNTFIGLDYSKMGHGGSGINERTTYINDSTGKLLATNYLNGEGERNMHHDGQVLKAGFDYNISSKTILSVSGDFGTFSMGHDALMKIENFDDPSSFSIFKQSNSLSSRDRNYFNTNLNLQHNFNDNGHQLTALVYFSKSKNSESESQEEYLTDANWNNLSDLEPDLMRTTESGDGTETRIKIDYVNPISEKNKFEAGYQARIEDDPENYNLENYDPDKNIWIKSEEFSSAIDFKNQIHALYTTYSGELATIGYQAGLRGEYTYRSIKHTKVEKPYEINKADFFPSLHLSKEINKNNQLQLSYSRRINRPRGWDLEPFPQYMNSYNIRMGNPDLKNEYVNSYEMSYMRRFMGMSFVTIEGYYRETINPIERYTVKYNEEVMLMTVTNLDKNHSLGLELMANIVPVKWLTINASATFYNYSLEGTLLNEEVDRSSQNWNARLNGTVNFSTSSRLQINGFYRGPSATAQGTSEGFFMSSVAYRQDFFKKRLSATLQIQDLFNSMKMEMYSSGPGFDTHMRFTREGTVVMLTLSYKINNYKAKMQRGENGGSEVEMDMDNGFKP